MVNAMVDEWATRFFFVFMMCMMVGTISGELRWFALGTVVDDDEHDGWQRASRWLVLDTMLGDEHDRWKRTRHMIAMKTMVGDEYKPQATEILTGSVA